MPSIARREVNPINRPRMSHVDHITIKPRRRRRAPSWRNRAYRSEMVGMGDGGSRALIACKSERVCRRVWCVCGVVG